MSGAAGSAEAEETRAGERPSINQLPDAPPPLRPRKPGRRAPVPNPLSARINVLCQPAFLSKLTADAKERGMSLSAYVCARLADRRPAERVSPVSDIDRALLAKLLGELGKIGSNHNQLARTKNRKDADPDLDEWRRIEEEIQEMRRALMKALGYAG